MAGAAAFAANKEKPGCGAVRAPGRLGGGGAGTVGSVLRISTRASERPWSEYRFLFGQPFTSTPFAVLRKRARYSPSVRLAMLQAWKTMKRRLGFGRSVITRLRKAVWVELLSVSLSSPDAVAAGSSWIP
jgi:hypothetical protein